MTSQPAHPTQPVEVFYSYSHKDEKLRDELETHLAMLRREGGIRGWHDRQIRAGKGWDGAIHEKLKSADIILLLVSSNFLASDYCYDVEVGRAMERDAAGEARVIPIILRPCDWTRAPFAKLQALPKNAKPITRWKSRDEAFLDVAEGIRRAAEELLATQRPNPETQDESLRPSTPTPIPRPPVFGFVSRRDEQGNNIVERLKDELAPGRNQLVTLSGPGGIGKTTLAAEAARSLLEAYASRVVWSSADGRTDFSLLTLLDDIATRLGRPQLRTLAPEAKTEQVRAFISDPSALVVLDNYETIDADEQRRIAEWFSQTQCSALFTSRPRIPDTVFVPVSAMSREEAAEFLERLATQAQDPQLFTPEVRESVYETADANPYVMQWVVAQIDDAQEASAVLKELAEGEGGAAERVFARSFNLPRLGDDGRDALLALSLFAPTASRDALAVVADLGEDRKRLDDAVRHLHALWLIKGVDGNRRLAVEGLTRTLAAAWRSKDPRDDEFRRRFVAYFLRYTEERREPMPENYDALEAERENLLGAAETAYTSGEWASVMRIAYALARPATGMLGVRCYWDEAIKLGEQALEAARSLKDEAQLARFSHNLAIMYQNRVEPAEARRLYDESLEIKKKLGNQDGVAITLHQLGKFAQERGELEEARRFFEESLEIAKRLGNRRVVAAILHHLAMLAQDQGELGEARRLYDESLEINKRLGDQGSVASTMHQLGLISLDEEAFPEAESLLNESLTILRKLGHRQNIAECLESIGNLKMRESMFSEAHRLFDESLLLAESVADTLRVASVKHSAGLLAGKEGDEVEAARLFREALSIYERLGSPNAELARRSLARVEGETS